MITLEQTLTEQENLEKLCALRRNPTADVFGGNGHYGVADIYKTYAEVPLTRPLNGVVPHGVSMSETWLWDAEAGAPVPYVYCYPEFRQEVFRNKAKKKIILSASPFMYVMDMLKEHPKPDKLGTLFFPMHSTEHIIIKQSYDKLADLLLEFDPKYQPVHVCLYWKDYLLGAADSFLARGIKVVSAGHLYDRTFLYRFYHLCSQYQYIADNETGSQLFYTVKMGCSYFHIDFGYKQLAPAETLKRDGELETDRRHNIREMFRPRVATPTQEQRALVDYYLGAEYFKSREELRNDILAA